MRQYSVFAGSPNVFAPASRFLRTRASFSIFSAPDIFHNAFPPLQYPECGSIPLPIPGACPDPQVSSQLLNRQVPAQSLLGAIRFFYAPRQELRRQDSCSERARARQLDLAFGLHTFYQQSILSPDLSRMIFDNGRCASRHVRAARSHGRLHSHCHYLPSCTCWTTVVFTACFRLPRTVTSGQVPVPAHRSKRRSIQTIQDRKRMWRTTCSR